MEYRDLGNTEIKVSRLCFGSLTVGPLQKNMPATEAGELIAAAFYGGVNFIDTAQLYGTYPHIAAALKIFKKDVVIATKSYAYTRDMVVEAVDEARLKLGRDVIDIFLLHEQESEHTVRGHMEALDELFTYKAHGKVRAVGLSTHHVAGVEAAIKFGLDVVHPIINIEGIGIADGAREDMELAIAKAHGAGVGVYAMKALGGGHLYMRPEEALGYALCLEGADSIAVGMQSFEEIESNIAFFESGGDMNFPSALKKGRKRSIIVEDHCTGCGHCLEGCMQGSFEIRDGKAVWNSENCILCGYCGAYCANFCIKMT